jgi:polyhydroxyalkanoate synthesis regulator phasin
MTNHTETLKKVFLMGLGATVLTAEKIKDLVDELVSKGELTQEEGKKFGDDLKARALQEKEQMEQKIKETADTYFKKAVHSMGLVTREEFEALKAQVKPEKKKKE